MTDEERLQWESEKHSVKVAHVLFLDSGRIAFADYELKNTRVVSDNASLWLAVMAASATPLPTYSPPTLRKSGLDSLELDL